jgi:hypothetical protein
MREDEEKQLNKHIDSKLRKSMLCGGGRLTSNNYSFGLNISNITYH